MIRHLYNLLQILLKQNAKTQIKKQKLLIYDVYLKKYVNADELLIPSPTKESIEGIHSWKNPRDFFLFRLLLKKFVNPRLDLLSPAGVSGSNLSNVLDPNKIQEYRYASTLNSFWEKGSGIRIQSVPALPSIGDVGGEIEESTVGWAGQLTGKPESNPRPEHGSVSSIPGIGDSSDKFKRNNQSAKEKGQSKKYHKTTARNGDLLYEGNLERKKKGTSTKSVKSETDVVIQNKSKINVWSKKSHKKHSCSKKHSDVQSKSETYISNDTNKEEILRIKSPKKETGTFLNKIRSKMLFIGTFGRREGGKTYNEVGMQGKDKLSKSETTVYNVKNTKSDMNLEENDKGHQTLTNPQSLMNCTKKEITNKRDDSSNRGVNKIMYKKYEELQSNATTLKREPPSQKVKNENIKALTNDDISTNEVKQKVYITSIENKADTNTKNKRVDATNTGVRTFTDIESKPLKKGQAVGQTTHKSCMKRNSIPTKTDVRAVMHESKLTMKEQASTLVTNKSYAKTDSKPSNLSNLKNTISITNQTDTSSKNEEVETTKIDGSSSKICESQPKRREQQNLKIANESNHKTDSNTSNLANLKNNLSITNKTDTNLLKNDVTECIKGDGRTVKNYEKQPVRKKEINPIANKSCPKNDSNPLHFKNFQNEKISKDKFQPREIKSHENLNLNVKCEPIKLKSVHTVNDNIHPEEKYEANTINKIEIHTPSKSAATNMPQSIRFGPNLRKGEKIKNPVITNPESPKRGELTLTNINIHRKGDSLVNDEKLLERPTSATNTGTAVQISSNSKNSNIEIKTQNKNICTTGSSAPREKVLMQVEDKDRDGKSNTIKSHNVEPGVAVKLQSISAQGRHVDDLALEGELNQYNIVNYRGFKVVSSKSDTQVTNKQIVEKTTLQNNLKKISSQSKYTDKILKKPTKLCKSIETKNSVLSESKSNVPNKKTLIKSKSLINDEKTDFVKNAEKNSEVKMTKGQEIAKNNLQSNKHIQSQSVELATDGKKHTPNKTIIGNSAVKIENVSKQNKLETSSAIGKNKYEITEDTSMPLSSENKKRNDFKVENKPTHRIRYSINRRKLIKPITFKYLMKKSRKRKVSKEETNTINNKNKKENTNINLNNGHLEVKNKLENKSKGFAETLQLVNKQAQRSKSNPVLSEKTIPSTVKQANEKHNIKTKSVETLLASNKVLSGKQTTNLKRGTKIASHKNINVLQANPTDATVQSSTMKKSRSEVKYSLNPNLQVSNRGINRGSKKMAKASSKKFTDTASRGKVISKKSLPSKNKQTLNKTTSKHKTNSSHTKLSSRDIPKRRKEDRIGKPRRDKAKHLGKEGRLRKYTSASPKNMDLNKHTHQVSDNLNKSSQMNKNIVPLKSATSLGVKEKQTNTISPLKKRQQSANSQISKISDQNNPDSLSKTTSVSKTSKKVVRNTSSPELTVQIKSMRNIGETQFNINNSDLNEARARNLSTSKQKRSLKGGSFIEQKNPQKAKTPKRKSETRPQSVISPNVLKNYDDLDNNQLRKQNALSNSDQLIKTKKTVSLNEVAFNNDKEISKNVNKDKRFLETQMSNKSRKCFTAPLNNTVSATKTDKKKDGFINIPRGNLSGNDFALAHGVKINKINRSETGVSKRKNESHHPVSPSVPKDHENGELKNWISKGITKPKEHINKSPTSKDKTIESNLKNKESGKGNLLFIPSNKKEITEKQISLDKYLKINAESQKTNTEINNKDKESYDLVNQLGSAVSKSKTISDNFKKEQIILNLKSPVKDRTNKSKQMLVDSKHSKKSKNTYGSPEQVGKTSANIKNDKNKETVKSKEKQEMSFLNKSKNELNKSENTTLEGSKMSGEKKQLNRDEEEMEKMKSKILNQYSVTTPKRACKEASTERNKQKVLNSINQTPTVVNITKPDDNTLKDIKKPTIERKTPTLQNSTKHGSNTLKDSKEPHSRRSTPTVLNSTKQGNNTLKDPKESHSGGNTPTVLNSTKQSNNTLKDPKESHSLRNTPTLQNSTKQGHNTLKEPHSGRNTPTVLNSTKQGNNTLKDPKEPHSGRNTPTVLNSTKQGNNTLKDPKEPHSGRNTPTVLNSTKQGNNTLKDPKEPHSGRNTPTVLRAKQCDNSSKKSFEETSMEMDMPKQLHITKPTVNTDKETQKEQQSFDRNKLVGLNSLKLTSSTHKEMKKHPGNIIVSKAIGKKMSKNSTEDGTVDKLNVLRNPHYNIEGNKKLSYKLGNNYHSGNKNKNSLIKDIHSEIKDNKIPVATSESKQEISNRPSQIYDSGRKKMVPTDHKLTAENRNLIRSSISKNKTDLIHNVNNLIHQEKGYDVKSKTNKLILKQPQKIPANMSVVGAKQLEPNSKINKNPNTTLHDLNYERSNAVMENFGTTAKDLTWCVSNQNKPSESKNKFDKDMFVEHTDKYNFRKFTSKKENVKRVIKGSIPKHEILKEKENNKIDKTSSVKNKRFDVSPEIIRKLSSLSQKATEETKYSPLKSSLISGTEAFSLDKNKNKARSSQNQFENSNILGNNQDKFLNDLLLLTSNTSIIKKQNDTPIFNGIKSDLNKINKPNYVSNNSTSEQLRLTIGNNKIESDEKNMEKDKDAKKRSIRTGKEEHNIVLQKSKNNMKREAEKLTPLNLKIGNKTSVSIQLTVDNNLEKDSKLQKISKSVRSLNTTELNEFSHLLSDKYSQNGHKGDITVENEATKNDSNAKSIKNSKLPIQIQTKIDSLKQNYFMSLKDGNKKQPELKSEMDIKSTKDSSQIENNQNQKPPFLDHHEESSLKEKEKTIELQAKTVTLLKEKKQK